MKRIIFAIILVTHSTQILSGETQNSTQATTQLKHLTQTKPGFLLPTFAGLTVGAGIGIASFHGIKWGAQSLLDYSSKHFAQTVWHNSIKQATTFTQTEAFKPVLSGFAVFAGAYCAARFASTTQVKYELIKAKNDAINQTPQKIDTLSAKVKALSEEMEKFKAIVATKAGIESALEPIINKLEELNENLTNPVRHGSEHQFDDEGLQLTPQREITHRTVTSNSHFPLRRKMQRTSPEGIRRSLDAQSNQSSIKDSVSPQPRPKSPNISQENTSPSYFQRAALGATGAIVSGLASLFFN